MAGFGIGASLANMGSGQQREATQLLQQAANQEDERNRQNKALAAQEKAGKRQLGSTLGATAGFALGAQQGSVGGPWGALIGGVVGYVAGGLFSLLAAVVLVVSLAVSPQPAEAMIVKPGLTQMDLHQVLSYDPLTGIFTWIDPAARCLKPGDRAGFVHGSGGYRHIKISSKMYAEHRLAWLYMTGEWPMHEIDHQDRDRTNNKFDNLRPATHKQNCENRGARKGSLSGFRGVSWSHGKWHASIMHFGAAKDLGYFDDLEQAKEARLTAERELFTHSTRT